MCLVLSLCLCGLPVLAGDLTIEEHVDNACGENLVWALSGTTLTISGTGPMNDFTYSEPAPWAEYADAVVHVVLEEGVTSVGSLAFYRMEKILDVSLPDSLETIGESAFYYCSVLSGVEIPAGVTSIGSSAFGYCGMMDSVSIPSGVTTLENDLFSGCSRLTAVEIPKGVTTVGSGAFANCTRLETVSLPGTVETMGDNPFRGCVSLENLTVSGKNLRYENSLLLSGDGEKLIWVYPGAEAVSLPDGLREIGSYAFADCTALRTLEIPDGIRTIGGGAFDGCTGLEALLIPPSVEEIGSWALENGEYGGYTEGFTVYYGGDEVGWGALMEEALSVPENVEFNTLTLPVEAPQVTPQTANQSAPESVGAQEASEPVEKNALGPIIGCAVGAVLVVGIAVAAVLGNKRKKANV